MAANIAPEKTSEVARRPGGMSLIGDFAFSLSRLRDEFDRMFERMTREFPLAKLNGEGWRWGLDVEDRDDNVLVRAEAPGFEANDFDIRVEDGRLVLRAERKVETKDDKGRVQETVERQCYDSVALPAGIDKDKVDAQYRNGVLTIQLAKTPAAKAKRVPVKEG